MAIQPQTMVTNVWPGMPVDLAISDECRLLGPGEENWLKDSLRY